MNGYTLETQKLVRVYGGETPTLPQALQTLSSNLGVRMGILYLQMKYHAIPAASGTKKQGSQWIKTYSGSTRAICQKHTKKLQGALFLISLSRFTKSM